MKNESAEGRAAPRGTIVVFVLILSAALLGVLGLAIDTGIMLSSRAQLERSSQQAALASMSRFLLVLDQPLTAQYTSSQRYTDAINQSKAQAEAILRLNPFLGDTFRVSETQWALSSPLGAASGAVGTLEYGKYYVEQPPGQVSQVCPEPQGFPCFVPLAGGGSSANPATAVRVSVNTNNKPLRPIFGKLLGAASSSFSTQAVSTKIIQNLAFLIDLSSSVVNTGYLRFGAKKDTGVPPSGGSCATDPLWFLYSACRYPYTASNYAYQLSDAWASSHLTPGQTPNTYCSDGSCLYSASLGQLYSSVWAEGCPTTADINCTKSKWPNEYPPITPFFSNPNAHAQENFARVNVDFNYNTSLNQNKATDMGSLPEHLWSGSLDFFIDKGASCPAGVSYCAKPEPLLSILKTSGRALDIMYDRAVPGDRVMVSGFDEYLYRSRTTCEATTGAAPTTNCQRTSGQSKLVRIQASDFTSFRTALGAAAFDSATGNPLGNPPPYITSGFFPRYMNTDGNLMVWDTFQEMNAVSTSRLARNMIFIFTDGLFNCTVANNQQIQSFASGAGGYFSQRVCGGPNPDSVTNAINQIQNLPGPTGKTLIENLIDSKISVSVFMFGAGAHRLVRKSPTGTGCLSLEEAIYGTGSSTDYVAPIPSDPTYDRNQAYLKAITGLPNAGFYEQNALYSALVKPTHGKWAPILNRITYTDGSGATVPFDFSSNLQTACNGVAAADGIVRDLSVNTPDGSSYYVVDHDGRLLFDPVGRSPEDQISDSLIPALESGFVLARS